MKHAIQNTLIFGLLANAALGYEGYPQADRMEPKIARVGMVLTISGRALDQDHVDEVYLTDHRFDMKVKIVEQSDTTLKIRVPPFVKPGRLQLLLLSKGDRPAYLEQPMYVQVEDGEALPEEPAVITKSTTPPAKTRKAAKPTVEVASLGNRIPVPPEVRRPEVKQSEVRQEEAPPQRPVIVAPAAPVPAAPAPAPAPAPVAVVPAAQVNREIVPPRLVKRAPVAMPSTSAGLGSDNSVELSVHVTAEGKIGSVKLVRGNPILGQAAIRSVREWVYESAYIGSTPVDADLTVVLNFKR